MSPVARLLATLATISVLGGTLGAAGGVTLAAFSSGTSNQGNSFQAATLAPPSDLSVTEVCAGGGIEFRGKASAGTDGSPLTIAKPAGVVEGDVMVAAVVTRFSTETISPPAGWTTVRNEAPGGRQKVFYKVAGASEPASYSFSGTGRSAGGIVAYSGVDTSSPIDVHGAQSGSGSTVTAPSVTTTSANTMLVGIFSIGDSSSMTSPSSMTQRFTQTSSGSGGSGHHVRMNVAQQAFTGPGATGTFQATSAASAWNIGVLLALRSVPTQWDASLSWTATPTSWAQGYVVQRWVGGSLQNQRSVTPRTTTTAIDGPLAADTTYEFRVQASYMSWRSTAATVTLTTGSSCGTASGGGGGSLTYRQTVMDDSPIAYWRLGDTDVVLSDDFETFSGWSDLGGGTFTQSSEQTHGGTKSGKKDTNNDAVGGGTKSLGATLGDDWTLETWVYRPSAHSGGSQDRVGVESAAGDGYSFSIDHSSSALLIDRRDAGAATTLSSVSVNPPEDAWVRAVLSRSGSSLTFTLYNAAGTQLGTVSASDATHSTFERIAVRGGYHYYLDDLSVRTTPAAADETGTHDGSYLGGVGLGQTGALAGDSDTSVSLDGSDDHVIDNPFGGMPTSAISVEFWMKSSNTSKSGTPVSYATSSNNNEFLIFNYNNFTIHTGGANVSTGVSGNDGAWHHIVVTWRSSDGQAKLYKDGAQAWSGTLSSGTSIASGGSLVLGQEQDTVGGGYDPAQAFLGNLDEVAVYDTVLSPTRVQVHYDAGT